LKWLSHIRRAHFEVEVEEGLEACGEARFAGEASQVGVSLHAGGAAMGVVSGASSRVRVLEAKGLQTILGGVR
jgi:hypothetical protein